MKEKMPWEQLELAGIVPEKEESDRPHEREKMGSRNTYQHGEEKKTRSLKVEPAPEVAGGGRKGCRLPRDVTEKKRKKGRERDSMGGM